MDTTGTVLVPIVPLLEATGLPLERSRGDSLISLPHLGTGGGRNVLDLRSRQVRRPDGAFPVGPREAQVVAGEVYLATARIAELLQASVTVDVSALSVSFSRTPPVPAEQEAATEGRRARARSSSPAGPALPRVPYLARSGGAVLDWGITTSGPDPTRGTSARAELGLAVLGGDLALGGSLAPGGIGAVTQSDWNWSYRRGFPNSRLVRQLQVGDIVTGAALLRSVHGASITNSTIVREPHFARVLLTPDIPQGWEYEVYQNGELLGFSEAGTRTPVAVPLRYGSTPLQVRMFSPAGEEVVSEVLYQVPPTQLRPGRVEYSAGAGVCPREACDYLAYATVDAGLTPWLTVGGGLEATSDSLRRALLPQGSVSMAWLTGWSAQLQAARSAFVRGSLAYFGTSRVTGAVTGGINYPGSGQLSFVPATTPRWYAESSVSTRLPSRVRSVRLETRAEGPTEDRPDRWRAHGSFDLPRATAETSYEYERAQGGGLFTVGGLALTSSTQGPGWLRNRPVGASVGWGEDGLQLLQATFTLQPRRTGYLALAARWDLRRSAPSLSLTYSSALRGARTQARLATTPEGGVLATAALSGAVSYDPRHGIVPLMYGGVRDAGVSGTVFYDENGNGRLDAGDRPAPGVDVRVGSNRARTDTAGRYRTWNVVPYDLSEVSVDTLRGIDPSWIPLKRPAYVRPTPHMYNPVDFALVRTRELAGRLEAGEGVFTVGGVTLELRETGTGRTESVVTFSDGEFYLSRVRPGEYELRVSEASLRALRARAEPAMVRFRVPAEGTGVLVDIPSLRLERAPA